LKRLINTIPLFRPEPSRWQQVKSDRVTLALAVSTIGIGAAILTLQYGRLFSRRRHEHDHDPRPEPALSTSAPAAAADTVNVALEGYLATPRAEKIVLHILNGFLITFASIRLITWAIREGHGPFRNVSVSGRHIHHFVPGILIAFIAAIGGLIAEGENSEDAFAFTLGSGMGLTFDEAALLLDLEDVYWTRQGLLSVQVSLATIAILGATTLVLRLLGRGEQREVEAGNIPAETGPGIPFA
jgi:hypothetical protein